MQHHRTHNSPAGHCVVVLGASPKPARYSFQAVALLRAQGYRVIPVHPTAPQIDGLPVARSLDEIREPVHTLSLYLGPARSQPLIGAILGLAPGRVILNPGTESMELEHALGLAGIAYEHACTLVLLKTGQL